MGKGWEVLDGRGGYGGGLDGDGEGYWEGMRLNPYKTPSSQDHQPQAREALKDINRGKSIRGHAINDKGEFIFMIKLKRALVGALFAAAVNPSVALAQSKPAVALPQNAASATILPAAAAQAPAPQRYLLLATFGYLGGQAGFMLSKGNGAAASSIAIIYNSSSQCEFAENQIKERWRNDVLNTLCMPFPDGAVVAH